MKTTVRFFVPVLLALFSFTACDTEDPNPSGESNYWFSNTLVRMRLKGEVKTLTTNGGEEIFQFNTDGNLTSRFYGNSNYSQTETYTYQNGKLISSVTTEQSQSVQLRTITSSTTTYEYENAGKFLPHSPFHIYSPDAYNVWSTGLVPGLSAVIQENHRTDYVFSGNQLLMIQTWVFSSGTEKDTTIVEYNGNYPASISNESSYCNDMTYASNGMFLTYSEGFTGQNNYVDDRAWTFLPNDTYLLPDTYVNTYPSEGVTTTRTRQYNYNEHMDLVSITGTDMPEEYTDYVYDEQGNWTSRKYRYKNGETWSEYTTETRVITYY